VGPRVSLHVEWQGYIAFRALKRTRSFIPGMVTSDNSPNHIAIHLNWSHPDVFSLKYSKSKFSQNTTNLLSIKVATCFDS